MPCPCVPRISLGVCLGCPHPPSAVGAGPGPFSAPEDQNSAALGDFWHPWLPPTACTWITLILVASVAKRKGKETFPAPGAIGFGALDLEEREQL